MKVKMISNDPWSPPLEFTLDRFPIVIGGDRTADISVDDRWISKQHCEVNHVDGVLTIRDLHSRHGTLINGKPITQSQLESGDTLTIGIRSFHVSIGRSGRRSGSPVPAQVPTAALRDEETSRIN